MQENVQNQKIETIFVKFKISSNDKKIIIKIIIKIYVNQCYLKSSEKKTLFVFDDRIFTKKDFND
jgi:hypothetical protein